MRVERRLVYALHGEDGAERAEELDALIKVSLEKIGELNDAITDWTGVCA